MKQVASVTTDAASPNHRRFSSAAGEHILVVPRSRIYDLVARDERSGGELEGLVAGLVDAAELSDAEAVSLDAVVLPTPQSISLNVSSSCNLSCAYCYASRGNFGGSQPRPMLWEVARTAIDKLIADASTSAPVTIGFIGGEPFVNRGLMHQAVRYATGRARSLNIDVRFSVTTNATLLEAADIEMLRNHPFAVTVSVDGDAETHESRRPLLSGRLGSYAKLAHAVTPLLERPGKAQVAARATVTRSALEVGRAFDAILLLGFSEVGFAPLKSGPAGSGALVDEDWSIYLRHLIELAQREVRRVASGSSIRLTNLAVALKQLHRGACSPYPCGAGGGYFSVGADGDWYTCHRAIGNAEYRVGTSQGLDEEKRARFLITRHVHSQTDCKACWARYLCSGGCHQEANQRTPASCDAIRGWLEFCLKAYTELSEQRPDFFESAKPAILSAADANLESVL